MNFWVLLYPENIILCVRLIFSNNLTARLGQLSRTLIHTCHYGSIFEPFQILKMKNLRNTLDISKYVTCSAITFSYWNPRSTSLKVVFLQQFINLTDKLRTAWFTSFLSGPPVYDVLQGIPISTHPPGVEKSSFNTICGSGSWWSTPPSFNPRPPFYLFIWFSLL